MKTLILQTRFDYDAIPNDNKLIYEKSIRLPSSTNFKKIVLAVSYSNLEYIPHCLVVHLFKTKTAIDSPTEYLCFPIYDLVNVDAPKKRQNIEIDFAFMLRSEDFGLNSDNTIDRIGFLDYDSEAHFSFDCQIFEKD